MDRLAADQIDEYLASGLWAGKAGAFGYQDRQGWLHIVAGSESNVVGLPWTCSPRCWRYLRVVERLGIRDEG